MYEWNKAFNLRIDLIAPKAKKATAS